MYTLEQAAAESLPTVIIWRSTPLVHWTSVIIKCSTRQQRSPRTPTRCLVDGVASDWMIGALAGPPGGDTPHLRDGEARDLGTVAVAATTAVPVAEDADSVSAILIYRYIALEEVPR